MFKVSRFAVAALLFAGAGVALAQPPGPERGRPGDKKDFPRREAGERKDGDQPKPPAEALERELQMLRARIAEVEARLKGARDGDKGPEPKRDEQPKSRDSRPMGPGGFNPPMGQSGGFPFGRGGPGGPGFGGFPGGPMGNPGFVGPGMNLPLEQMSPEQIKQLIGKLQQVLEAKTRGGDQPKKPEGNKGDQPKKPEGNKGDQQKEDVMKRLERIQKELEDIRRSLGK